MTEPRIDDDHTLSKQGWMRRVMMIIFCQSRRILTEQEVDDDRTLSK